MWPHMKHKLYRHASSYDVIIVGMEIYDECNAFGEEGSDTKRWNKNTNKKNAVIHDFSAC